ncbi:MAG: hypothetical protein OEZ36_07210 [Spirochaetota bacterium]|nr:hypothetical protein [Spirochaetota bacterium]
MRFAESPLNSCSNSLFAKLVLNTLGEKEKDRVLSDMRSALSPGELARLNRLKGRSHKEITGHRSVA